MKIVADNKIPFLKGVFEPYACVEYLPGKAIGSDALKDASALITRTRTKCTKALLEGSSVRLMIVCDIIGVFTDGDAFNIGSVTERNNT